MLSNARRPAHAPASGIVSAAAISRGLYLPPVSIVGRFLIYGARRQYATSGSQGPGLLPGRATAERDLATSPLLALGPGHLARGRGRCRCPEERKLGVDRANDSAPAWAAVEPLSDTGSAVHIKFVQGGYFSSATHAGADTAASTLYAARGRPIPLSVNSPTGSTVTASLTAVKTRGLIRI